MKLEDIGFYTLSDARAENASATSPLWRCEVLVTNRCNFNCPYCRHVGPERDMSWFEARNVLDFWIDEGLKNVRFSGGEPTLWPHLLHAVAYCKANGVERIAISTNGSASLGLYDALVYYGASDFSISFDACCAEGCEKMSGHKAKWEVLCDTIEHLSAKTYVTVGVVLTEDNENEVACIVDKAHALGVADVRVIPAAQRAKSLDSLPESSSPILEYRRKNAANGDTVRGLTKADSPHCMLVLDDMAVVGDKHYPCIIYAREGGSPIGDINGDVRNDRLEWMESHDCVADTICSGNCLDVCRAYNNTARRLHPLYPHGANK